jgi:outer membrane protein OmpA-like peptidoglycan-associated protein
VNLTSASIVALALAAGAAPAAADELSNSIMRPTKLDPVATMVAGRLPGGSGSTTYYLAADLEAGSLMTQLQVAAHGHDRRRLTLELLNASAEPEDKASVIEGFADKDDTTKAFAINHAGRHILRLIAEGVETGTFCVVLGGTALPNANPAGCPSPQVVKAEVKPVVMTPPVAVAIAKPVELPPPPKVVEKPVEVIVSKCEERLRVGSDFLFDFDRAEVRPEADPALAELSQRIAAAHKLAMVEGHTDAIGTDSYNQRLSERRADAVRTALVARGASDHDLATRGFGKSKPIAPNQNPDGTDNVDGRQKNRRVEVVINTCS